MQKVRIDLSGRRVGRWLVLGYSHTNKKHQAKWHCRCDCGVERAVDAGNLLTAATLSCGCLNREACTVHGQYKKRIYRLWVGMFSRCIYPYAMHFDQYGGRGVKVCERWMTFANFYADMGDPPSLRHSLDRYPNRHGDYQPDNVRWATMKEQNRNKDCVILNEAKAAEIRALRGILFQREIAEKFGVSRGMVGHIQRGKAWV